MQELYPKINAIMVNKKIKYKTDLSKQYGQKHIIDKNKLYYLKYDIGYFEYKYIGENKIIS